MTRPGPPEASPGGRIEIRVREMAQLFDSFDPSPFYERDLDPDAEAYLLASARAAPPGPLAIAIALREPHPEAAEAVPAALAAHFEREALQARRRLQTILREGVRTLGVGLFFLAACFLGASAIGVGARGVLGIVREGLVVVGWVALWRPLELLLYAWYPVRKEWRLHARLAAAPVTVTQPPSPDAGA